MSVAPPKRTLSILLAMACFAAVPAACSTGTTSSGAPSSATPNPAESKPAVRLYLLSNVAGALEPCGCSKDQLGGASHFANLLASEREEAGTQLLLGAGPLFFQDPKSTPEKATQDQWKAEALADGVARLGLVAWAPGANDFGAGEALFRELVKTSKGSFVAANANDGSALVKRRVVEAGGVKIGITGALDPKIAGAVGGPLANPEQALAAEVAALKADGARVIVVLTAMPRGEALRLTDSIKEIDVLVVGKPTEKGDANDAPRAPVLAGTTLVVEASNHLQTVAKVDLYLREAAGSTGDITLADGGGLARAEQLLGLDLQIRELEHRINGWEQSKTVRPDDVAARKKDLERLRTEKATLESTSVPTPEGSYFKYSLVEVREKLGKEPGLEEVTLGYYKRVNLHNKDHFKDRKPVPAEDGGGFVGIDKCSTCHAEERAVWDKTDHAKAYATLEKKFVEFNLDCVSCHVTGYEKPGGSTVTHVAEFKNVQCETCHGPGAKHAAAPTEKGLIQLKPEPRSCVSECHHPPHVEGFDPVAKMASILGPGHGL